MGPDPKVARGRRQLPKKKKPAFHPSLLIGLLIVAGLALFWFYRYGDFISSPRFNYIQISINGEPRTFLSGESILLHPSDRIKILQIFTNIPLNHEVRLWTKDLDVERLRYEEAPLANLLSEPEGLNEYRFRVWIKYRTRDLAYMDWKVRPYAEDWLERANRIINAKRRLSLLERAHSALPQDRKIEQRLLSEYKAQGQLGKAAGILEGRAGKKPDKEILNELLGVYRAMHHADGVISVLKRLVKLDPEDLEARRGLADALERYGKKRAAIGEYKALLSRLSEKDRLTIYKHLGYLCTETGRYEEAISYYLLAADLDKKDGNLYYNLSYLYERLGQKAHADYYLEKAVELGSADEDSRLKLARREIEMGELDRAEKNLTAIIHKNRRSLEAWILLARLREKQGKKEALKEAYRQVLSLDPANETVIYNLAVLEYESGNLAGSLIYLEKYLKAHPNDPEVHQILFDIYQRQAKKKKAFDEAMVLVKLKPKAIDIYRYIFDYLNSEGDYGRIIPIMQRGLKAGPDQTMLREYLVVCYLKMDKPELAVKEMEEILRRRPRDVGLLLQLAKLKEKLGKYQEALEAYKRIIDISPGHEEAEEGYLRLRLKGVEREEGE